MRFQICLPAGSRATIEKDFLPFGVTIRARPVVASSKITWRLGVGFTVATVRSKPFDDTVADAFRTHLDQAVTVMGGSRFAAQPTVHCTDRYKFGQCRIHVVPEVTE